MSKFGQTVSDDQLFFPALWYVHAVSLTSYQKFTVKSSQVISVIILKTSNTSNSMVFRGVLKPKTKAFLTRARW